jgi:hypothetical protein
MGELPAELRRLSGTKLDVQGAANAYAGTTGLSLVGALNKKAGTSGLALQGVVNKLAGTVGLGVNRAASLITSGTVTPVGLPADDFNRADNATTLGTMSSGHTWTPLTGTWGITGNQAYCPSGNGHVVVDTGVNDYMITVLGSVSDSGTAIIFRVQDATHWYMLVRGSGLFRIYKNNAGTLTNIFAPGVTVADGDTYGIDVRGNTFTAYKNGVNVGGGTDSAYPTGGRVGLRADTSTGRFDNFTVTS